MALIDHENAGTVMNAGCRIFFFNIARNTMGFYSTKKPIPKFMNGEFPARRKCIPCRQLPVSVGSGDKEIRRNRKKSIEGFLGQEGLRRLYRSMEAMLGAYTRRGYGRRVSPFREGFDQHRP